MTDTNPSPTESVTPVGDDATERSLKDYAIEFGEYAAKAAEHYMKSVGSVYGKAKFADDIDFTENTEAYKALTSAIYEFRKRMNRAFLDWKPTGRGQDAPCTHEKSHVFGVFGNQSQAMCDDCGRIMPKETSEFWRVATTTAREQALPQWSELPTSERNYPCASGNCGGQQAYLFVAGDVASKYCAHCTAKICIRALAKSSPPTGEGVPVCSTYHSRAVGVACSNCGHKKDAHDLAQGAKT